MAAEHTAAGDIEVIDRGRSEKRGGTTIFLGIMPSENERIYVVTSRFEYYVKTKSLNKAEKVFRNICSE